MLNLLYSSPDLSLDLQLSPGPCPGSLPVACIQSPVSFWLETHVSFLSPFLNLGQPRPCTSLPGPLKQAGFHCSVRLLPRLGDLRLGFIWVSWTPVKILVSRKAGGWRSGSLRCQADRASTSSIDAKQVRSGGRTGLTGQRPKEGDLIFSFVSVCVSVG